MQDSIRKQLHNYVSFFVIMLGLLIFIPVMAIERIETTNEAKEQLDLVLQSKAFFFEKWLEERSRDIHAIANLDIVREYNIEEARQYFYYFRQEKQDFSGLIFVNKEGIVVFDTIEPGKKGGAGMDVTEREYFQVAKETKTPYITDVMISLVTKKPIVIFASPILDNQNEFNGVVFGTVNLETIDSILSELHNSFQGHSYVVKSDGTLLSEIKDALQLEEENVEKYTIDSHILSLLQNNHHGKMERYRGVQGNYVLGSSVLVNNNNWYLVSEISVFDVYSSFYKKILLFAVMTVIGMFIASRIMLYVAKKFEKPIQQLLEGVRHMESGDYDYRIEETNFKSTPKEFQELVKAFNQMSGKVSKNVDVLEELTTTCQLTQLHNRRYLMEQGKKVFDACVRTNNHCSCIIVDIDYFKNINDTYGHIVGDQVLIHLARLLTESVRSTDIVTRYGGEEFVIISPKASVEDSVKIAERIQRKIKENPFSTNGLTIDITVSIGIADYLTSDGVHTLTELIDLADKALYKAKENGRNQIKVAKGKVAV